MSVGVRRTLVIAFGLALTLSILDLSLRSMARHGVFTSSAADGAPIGALVAIIAGATLLFTLRDRRARTFTAFALAFAIGAAVQLRLGARLQSDGFYYFSYLRSLWFDHDVNFLNDYRMLGLGDKTYLFEPTITGHAHSAWTIGPAIVWAPFFAIGHVIALYLTHRVPNVSVDGTSYPYRQAVCLAGLFYGLLGVYFCMRLASEITTRSIALVAAVTGVAGSFMLWYIVREPTMTHAPSLAAVAAFMWLWVHTLDRRSLRQWIALGALGGLMALIRWQSAIYGLLPLSEFVLAIVGAVRVHDSATVKRLAVAGVAGLAAFIICFSPQMFAWKAIYGHYFAVSPVGPQLRWADQHMADVLWSSRNGLFAFSLILYLGALGLPILAIRRPRIGVIAIVAFLAMVYFNSIIQDWWGSAGFGGRRFDGAVPLLILGLATMIDSLVHAVRKRPWLPAAAVVMLGTSWAWTFRASAAAGVFSERSSNDFGDISADQVARLHNRIGHPFSFPANAIFAVANGVKVADYDLLEPNTLLADPDRPSGRIDVGAPSDRIYVGDGFSDRERDGQTTYRWASARAELIVSLARRTTLHVQLRLHALSYPGAPDQHVVVRINGVAFGPIAVPLDWATVEFDTPVDVWRTTVNHVVLEFDRADRPSDHGLGEDHRLLAAAIDYLNVAEEPRK